MTSKRQWENSREVIERIFIRGTLRLITPAHFGNGDAEGWTDIPLLYDSVDEQKPLLTGASIAGALRNYLREYERGCGWPEDPISAQKSLAERLFGHLDEVDPVDPKKKIKSTVHSWLMVDDALGGSPKEHPDEWRDGVAIDPRTRTVEEDEHGGHKYDFALLAAGTTFPLSFEFWLTEKNADLLPALVTALQGFERGEIGLGMRKRRGLGECKVTDWQVWRYKMDTADGLIGWLEHDLDNVKPHTAQLPNVAPLAGQRKMLTLKAEFELDGSLLVRSGTGESDAPDMVHLQSYRNAKLVPILSGTSVAGAMRGRALRIANTKLGKDLGGVLVDEMFGRRIREHDDEPSGSRVLVKEQEIPANKTVGDLVQSRVKIDRFTGGAYPQALFSEQPIWGKKGEKAIEINVALRQSHDDKEEALFKAQTGLLLLVLKDLWTGDLPLGGESSVGRGRLRGKKATIEYDGKSWKIEARTDGKERGDCKLDIIGKDEMEKFVTAFCEWKGSESPGGKDG